MLLLYVIVSCVLLGASTAQLKYESVCYGRSVLLPFSYRPPLFNGQLYFTAISEPAKLLMDKGEAKDPRLKVSYGSVKFTDLTERDDGGILSVDTGVRRKDIISLKILDCAEKKMQYYGDTYSCDIPREAEFLEFTRLDSGNRPELLWNRTNPQISRGGKGRVKRNVWEIRNVNQADMGHYNFRAKDNTLLSRILLKVEAHKRFTKKMVNERLFMQYPADNIEWTVTFLPSTGIVPFKLMERGVTVNRNDWFSNKWSDTGRIQDEHDGLAIDPLKIEDYGIFQFIDPEGNLAKIVEVEVEYEPIATSVYAAVAVGAIVVLIVCSCCVRRCCCKKSSSKREASVPQTAFTPAVYNHNLNQPAGPSYSAAPAATYSYQPVNSLVSREATNNSLEPPTYNSAIIHGNPTQPEVAPLGGQGVSSPPLLGSDCLSSDPEPKFELKGLPFPSAPPLSSDSTVCDVYTSDKLNFL